MFVKGRRDLVYFAFPKCASEWMRNHLQLEWNNIFDDMDWSICDLNYCHVKPSRFIHETQLDVKNTTIFTIVRNTYDRLYSSWKYGHSRGLVYAKDLSFKEFIDMIYSHRDTFFELPLAWMYMPLDMYFGSDLIPYVHFYQMDQLQELADFLENSFNLNVDPKNIINQSQYDSEEKYDEDMLAKVKELYSYEIERFGYTYNW